ncbi:hypothetical protein EGW08_018378 [Elysia chlorotica]|uniref:Uncharacterized protein n=1 Tax=Elysia chlorotica TaxID=188477 RepID=A0A433SX25_ELYCH|nr:hypothetical protein EGW08_018378 [Elysia chlorotica]
MRVGVFGGLGIPRPVARADTAEQGRVIPECEWMERTIPAVSGPRHARGAPAPVARLSLAAAVAPTAAVAAAVAAVAAVAERLERLWWRRRQWYVLHTVTHGGLRRQPRHHNLLLQHWRRPQLCPDWRRSRGAHASGGKTRSRHARHVRHVDRVGRPGRSAGACGRRRPASTHGGHSLSQTRVHRLLDLAEIWGCDVRLRQVTKSISLEGYCHKTGETSRDSNCGPPSVSVEGPALWQPVQQTAEVSVDVEVRTRPHYLTERRACVRPSTDRLEKRARINPLAARVLQSFRHPEALSSTWAALLGEATRRLQ